MNVKLALPQTFFLSFLQSYPVRQAYSMIYRRIILVALINETDIEALEKKKNSKMLKPNNSQHWLTKCSHNEHLNAPKETIRSNKSVPLTWLICRIINTSAPGVVPQDAPFLPPWCISLLETVINTDTCLMLLFNNRPATSPKTLT